MEIKIVAGHKVTTFRKNNSKLVLSMRDKAMELLVQKKPLKEIRDELEIILVAYKRSTSTYISFLPVNDWNKRESLSIRDSSYDCTYVIIHSEKEDN